MRYDCVTAGERLAHHLQEEVLDGVQWPWLASSLAQTGRGEELCEYFREICTINLTCRLVIAGTTLSEMRESASGRDLNDPAFRKEYRDYIAATLMVHGARRDQVLRLAVTAVGAARETVTVKERQRYKREVIAQKSTCYMCGGSLDFTETDPHRTFTVEHIWPRRYGGDSCEDNLLPACGACNNKKGNFATWGMTGVHALILGFSPSDDALAAIEGSYRFAMHYYAARRLARSRNCTLKRAFMTLGCWREPTPRDPLDFADFFNTINYRMLPDLQE